MTTIPDGGQIEMDLSDERPWIFDWDDFLPALVELATVGLLTVTCYSDPSESPALFVLDNITMLTGNRRVQFWMKPGHEGIYRIAHFITTNEVPAQKRERSFFVLVRQL